MGVPPLMSAKLRVVVLTGFGSRDEITFLAEIIGAAHADEAAFREVVFFFRTQGDGVYKHGQVVRIAADDLNKLIFTPFQRPIIDAACVLLAEAVFTALGNEATAIAGIFIIELFLVFVANGRAVDDHAGALDRLFRLEAGMHAHLDEFLPTIFVNGELCALFARDRDLGPVGHQRRALVKGDFIDAKLLFESRENADKRFADGSGADDMNNFLLCHWSSAPSF